MAVVGSAYVVVRAITSGFDKDVKRSFADFNRQALASRAKFQGLVRTGYALGPLVAQLLSSFGALAGGLVSLGAAVVATIPQLVTLAGVFTSLGLAALVTASAFSGVTKAISAGLKKSTASAKEDANAKIAAARRIEAAQEALADADERLTEAQNDLNKALKDGREELQQLGFDAEDAALNEKKAAIELEKARETLARVQDLPPNSRARREAQLAFAEAELNYRKSKDRNKDLQQQQSDLVDKSKNVSKELLDVAKATFPDVQDEGLLRLISATDTAQDAFKNVQQAAKAKARAERDALRAQEDAKKEASGGGGVDQFAEALNDLSPAAQSFVKFIIDEFIPALKRLRDAAAEGLFPGLEAGLKRLKDELFPDLEKSFYNLGQSVGRAFNSIVDSMVDLENKADLQKVFDQAGYVVEGFGKIFGNVYDSILSLLVGADSQVRRFVDFLVKKSGEFAKFLDTKQASGELDAFFKKTGDIAAQIGEIFGNMVSGIVNTTKAAFTPGGGGYIILDWLKEVTAGFETFSGSAEGQEKLSNWLAGTAENTKSILGTIGAYIKEILKAGADPNVGKFWNTLREGSTSFGSLLTSLNAGGPALANFIVSMIKFAEITLTTGAIQNFFNILAGAINTVVNVLSSPGVKFLFDLGSKLLAISLAFGTISKVIVFAGEVMAGSLMALGRAAMFLFNPIQSLGLAYLRLGPVLAPIAASLGLSVGAFMAVIAVVTALVALFVGMYNQSEIFREAIGKLIDAVGGALKGAFDTVKGALAEFKPQIEGVSGVLKTLGDFAGKYIVPLFQFTLVAAIKVFSEAIAAALRVARGLWEILTGNPIEGIKTIFGAVGKFIVNSIVGIWNAAKDALSKIPVFNSIMNAAQSAFGFIARLWNNTFAKIKFTVPGWVPGLGGKGFAIPPIPGFAEGGVIQPQPGGAIVRVAEAGRPERIEPLDEQGLSRRDRAIVAQLAGNGGGPANIINVYPSAGMNESELAAMIDRTLAFRLRRGGA